MNFRIGDLVYSPTGVVLVLEYDDHTKKASCISLCSRFVYEYDFGQIGLAFCETGHEVVVDGTKYDDGEVVQFKLGTKVSTGIVQGSDARFCNIVQMVKGTDGVAIQCVTTEVLIAKTEILGHACHLAQSLFRLRWNDLTTERVVRSFEAAQMAHLTNQLPFN